MILERDKGPPQEAESIEQRAEEIIAKRKLQNSNCKLGKEYPLSMILQNLHFAL
jgi:hypothetical protein